MRRCGFGVYAATGRDRGEIAIGEILEHCGPQHTRGALRARTVERDIEADVLFQEQMQRGMEVSRVAEVADDLVTIDIGLEESELHPIERRQQRERTVVHLLRGRRTQDVLAVVFTALQLGNYEMAHVLSR